MSEQPSQPHETSQAPEHLEVDESVPPRPEEEVADAGRADPGIPLE